MEITSEIITINKILNEYKSDQARIWMFDITHVKIAIKIYSKQSEEILYFVAAGCKHIKGFFSLCNPKLSVTQSFDNENSEILFKITDENSDFELTSTSGIALAKGLDIEFGDSFDDFIQDN
ncbi:hypothetical protein OF897_17370 [Chryseobacterium formosus]|uniref:Uncharacterized protein n=1 Tax=Chryseobacterium formosus TaxID=1537363 RepID=A0ABT3XVH3_9FLAO|nr:hypothetical protein [Chryseobacterium formosus]MCX8525688.1 hypothetical protein [Chryseobacterium formosus]